MTYATICNRTALWFLAQVLRPPARRLTGLAQCPDCLGRAGGRQLLQTTMAVHLDRVVDDHGQDLTADAGLEGLGLFEPADRITPVLAHHAGGKAAAVHGVGEFSGTLAQQVTRWQSPNVAGCSDGERR
jgi:hypothetical protein